MFPLGKLSCCISTITAPHAADPTCHQKCEPTERERERAKCINVKVPAAAINSIFERRKATLALGSSREKEVGLPICESKV